MEINVYSITSHTINLEKPINGFVKIDCLLVDIDDDGDCLKNIWEVYGYDMFGKAIKLKEISRKLPTYSSSYEDVEKVVKKAFDID